MKHDELVKALLHCSKSGVVECNGCEYDGKEWPVGCMEAMMQDAAAAIEELQAEQKKTVTQIFCEEQAALEGRCKDLMKQISELQAEVNGLIADAGARIGKAEADRPHWVSVEERLPEIGQLILLNFGGCFSIAARTEDEMFEGKRYWKLEDDYWERIEDDYYWMPIEPPKEV